MAGTAGRATTALQSASRGASYSMLLQVMFRVATFVLNILILRFTSAELLGVVNVRLTLLYSTVLFVGREAFRKACLSFGQGRPLVDWIPVVNLVWLSIPIGVISSMLLAFLWLNHMEQPDVASYALAVGAFATCAVLELSVEPLWILGQVHLYPRVKVAAEGIAIAVKCVSTAVLLVLVPQWGLLSFVIAQFAHTVALIAAYYGYFAWEAPRSGDHLPISSVWQVLPQKVGSSWPISTSMLQLIQSFLGQTVLKQLLTEGERFVMSFFSVLSFAQQGVYDAIINLGSLAARFLFQPIEENFYTFFAGLLRRGSPPTKESLDDRTQRHADEMMALQTLQLLLKLVVYIACVICTFSQAYSYLLLQLYGGTILTGNGGPMLLRTFSVYLLFLAVNGVTECFAAAVMDKVQVDVHTKWMLGFSVVFLLAAGFFTSALGSVGFILANSLNMLVRIIKSAVTIFWYVKERPEMHGRFSMANCLPRGPVVVAFALSLVVTLYSESAFCCDTTLWRKLLHVGVGALCLFACLGTAWLCEKPFLNDLKQLWQGKRRNH
eukprot:m.489991 g.489991  ORF g.489991 m.489991 type:complete len:551 (-) comp27332_c0_seq1:93-1745(-)